MLLGQLLWFGHAMIIIINYKLAYCMALALPLALRKKLSLRLSLRLRARRLHRPKPSYATHRVGLDLGLGVISNY